MEGPRTGLSVCLIVRDEERSLPRALASVVSVADELCVLDTGSQDATPDVARSFGAKVGRFDWVSDFSAARNASLAMARGSWILVLDADEELDASTLLELRAAMASEHLAWLVTREDLRPHGAPPDSILLARLFRNDPRIRYERPVHEDISESLFRMGVRSLDDSGVRLRHYGYLPEVLAERDKLGRNLAILQRRVRDVPGDIFSLHKLAQSLPRTEQASERLAALRAAFAAAERLPRRTRGDYPHLPGVYDAYACELARSGALTEAIEVVERGLHQFPDLQLLLYRRGDLARRVGDVVGAQERFSAALGPCRIESYHDTSAALGLRAVLGLGAIALDAGLYDDAGSLLAHLERLAPDTLPVRLLAVELAVATRKYSEAARGISRLLEIAPYDVGVKLLGGRLAWLTRAPDVAAEIWRSAVGPHEGGDLARIWLWLAEVSLGHTPPLGAPLREVVPRDTRTAAAHAIAAAFDGLAAPLDPAFRPAAVERQAVAFLSELGRYGCSLAVASSLDEPPPHALRSLFPAAAAE